MRADDLLKPVSPDAPCGDDLLVVDDPDFIDYYFNVEDRLPTSYFNILRNELFDPRSVDQKGESAQIEALLKRSRDIRLLVLEAKFQILAGRFKPFCETVQAIAGALELWPGDLHPVDALDRRNAIEELNALPTIAAPLDYAGLMNDRRIGDITYRAYATGSGKVPPRDGEKPGDSGAILGALGSADNAKAVETLYEQITGTQEALKRIAAVTRAGASPFTPTLGRLEEKLADMAEMVGSAREDLGGAAAAQDAPGTPAAPGDSGSPAMGVATAVQVSTGATTTTMVVQTAVGGIPDHRIAFQILKAVEKYFAVNEPASLALVLVTQARLLIGKPLVDALDALLPNQTGNVTLNFGTTEGFSIQFGRMRDIASYSSLPDASELETVREGDAPVPDVVSRDHAGLLLKQIEEFFRAREPASPIPILLFKARNMLSKDFNALLQELIPPRSY